MNDPKRLGVSSKVALVRGVLASADVDAPTSGAQDRAMRAALGALGGASVALSAKTAAAGVAKGGTTKGLLVASAGKWGLAFIVGATTAVAVVEVRESTRPDVVLSAHRSLATSPPGARVATAAARVALASAPVVAGALPQTTAHVAPPEDLVPARPARAAVDRAFAEPPAVAPPPAPRPEGLSAEAETVRGIADAVTHDPDVALAAIAVYRRRAPGRFAEEVDALEIEALVARGDRELARQAAHRFVGVRPESVHLARIRALTQERDP